MHTGRDIDRYTNRLMQVRERRPLSILFVNRLVVARFSTTYLQHHLAIAIVTGRMLLIPSRKVADSDPCTRRRPYLWITSHHHHRHMTATRISTQVDALFIDRIFFLNPLDSIDDVLLSQLRTTCLRMIISSSEVRLQHNPTTLIRKPFQRFFALLQIAAPTVK